MALSNDRNTSRRDGVSFEYPVAEGAVCFAGGIAALNASGYVMPADAVGTDRAVVGVFEERADNSDGDDGAIKAKVRRGVFRFANSSFAGLITLADCGKDCYVVDDATVTLTSDGGDLSAAGKVVDVDSGGVWVEINGRAAVSGG